PSSFLFLSSLPLSPNGKLDKFALPSPDKELSREAKASPRSRLELELVRIWEELLGVYPIGIRDNFFSQGGHSLLAVRLIATIRERLGRSILLAQLFQGATVEALAAVLEARPEPEKRSPLVVLNARGTKPPFFLIHPVGGTVLCYRDLAEQLGPDQP